MSKAAEDPPQQTPGTDEASKFFLGARSALKIGDMKAAERLLRRSLELSPNNYNYMLALARLLVQVDKNQPETESLLLAASEINVTAVEPRLIMAAMYEKLGNDENTRALLRGVLNIDPTNFIARRKLNQLNCPLPSEEDLLALSREVLAECRIFTESLPVDEAPITLPEKLPISKFATGKLGTGKYSTAKLDPVKLSATAEEIVADNAQALSDETESVEQLDELAATMLDLPDKPDVVEPAGVTSTGNNLDRVEQVEQIVEQHLSNNFAITPLHVTQETAAATLFDIPAAVPEEEIVNKSTDDLEVATYMADIAMVEAIKEEIARYLPPFEMELALPELAAPAFSIELDELGAPIEPALETLDVKKVIEIMRKFYFTVEEEVGRETAFLLMLRAKVQIESIYPALDNFEVIEDYKIIEFLSNDTFITTRTLEALATWMYLLLAMLGETALTLEATERATKRALPKGRDHEEELFIKIYQSIQI